MGVAVTLDLGPGPSPTASPIRVPGSPLVGGPAPAFELESLDGERVALDDYAGRPVVINFWASWCGPCREEFPLFAAAREAHEADGLEVLGIVHDDDAGSARAFAEEQGAGWPMLLDPDDTVWDAYAGLALPTTFWVDREGIVQTVSFGPPNSGSLDDLLARIL